MDNEMKGDRETECKDTEAQIVASEEISELDDRALAERSRPAAASHYMFPSV